MESPSWLTKHRMYRLRVSLSAVESNSDATTDRQPGTSASPSDLNEHAEMCKVFCSLCCSGNSPPADRMVNYGMFRERLWRISGEIP